ncbi:MAG: ABC transporter permease [Chloroflexi bacterium]|nr:ABC transporter permease [Chloroflexota bacterium]MBU1748656.1 ABC transporter permease [Chloroflexota bacterium]
MNIFVRELRANLRSLLIWGGIVILFVTVGVSKFSAYAGNPEMLAILDTLPEALLAAVSLRAFDLTTVTGFFGILFTYYALLLSIAATMWGSDIISKEERDKTIEFSLTLPVTRSRVVTAKTLAALVNCIGLLLITWVVSIVSAQPYQPDSGFYQFLFLCILALFILELIFLSIGILLGCAMKRYKRASAIAVSLLLGTYFLSIISGLNENLDFLKYFSPFKYFDPVIMLHESRLDLVFVGLSAAIIVLSMAGAYLTYARRDLYI